MSVLSFISAVIEEIKKKSRDGESTDEEPPPKKQKTGGNFPLGIGTHNVAGYTGHDIGPAYHTNTIKKYFQMDVATNQDFVCFQEAPKAKKVVPSPWSVAQSYDLAIAYKSSRWTVKHSHRFRWKSGSGKDDRGCWLVAFTGPHAEKVLVASCHAPHNKSNFLGATVLKHEIEAQLHKWGWTDFNAFLLAGDFNEVGKYVCRDRGGIMFEICGKAVQTGMRYTHTHPAQSLGPGSDNIFAYTPEAGSWKVLGTVHKSSRSGHRTGLNGSDHLGVAASFGSA